MGVTGLDCINQIRIRGDPTALSEFAKTQIYPDAVVFRWTDGTKVDFLDWAKKGQGSNWPQPGNETPIEVVVDSSAKTVWHDNPGRANTKNMVCKRKPDKIVTLCPTTTTPPEAVITEATTEPKTNEPTSEATTTPVTETEATTQKRPDDIGFETIAPGDVPTIGPPAETSPPTISPSQPPRNSCRV